MMDDFFPELCKKYGQGYVSHALRLLYPNPEASYDTLHSDEFISSYVVNYIDSTVFGNLKDSHFTGTTLLKVFSQNQELVKKYEQFISRLEFEHYLLSIILDVKVQSQEISHHSLNQFLLSDRHLLLLTDTEIQDCLSSVAESFREQLKIQITMSQGLNILKKKKQQYMDVFKKFFNCSKPWNALSYSLPIPQITYRAEDVPVLFLEPLDGDYTSLLTPLKGRFAIFIFQTYAHLCHLLQFPIVMESLCDPKHMIYILEVYPNEQFIVQDYHSFQNQSITFQPILLTKQKYLNEALQALMESLKACLEQSNEAMLGESPIGNWLYTVANRLNCAIRLEMLGVDRSAAYREAQSLFRLFYRHDGLPPPGKDLGGEVKNLFAKKLNQLSKEKLIRHNKIKLVHVVPQIVDGGHAPSIILNQLISFCDKEKFELVIISTERLQTPPMEYPLFLWVNSESSERRGAKYIQSYKDLGVQVIIQSQMMTFEQRAREIANLCHQLCVDIAVFHGPDTIHAMTVQLSDVPTKVFFDHGTMVSDDGYDLCILSAVEALEIYKDQIATSKMKAHALPYHVDIRKQWLKDPYQKKQLGVPEDALVMTTISNHLKTRITRAMCEAIVAILRRVPNAYYVPMGPSNDLDSIREFFKEQQVYDRVIFLGSVNHPSQYARSADLYLNEFPFGSCLGMLDAMACGCPVVSMYNTEGPYQGRYGGVYFGLDKVITSCKKEEYIELACRLLTDPKMYLEWSEHSKKQYEKFADVPAYVRKFEEIITSQYPPKNDSLKG